MKNKNLLVVGLVGGLLFTNGITVYQYKKEVSELDLQVDKVDMIIQRQQSDIFEKNSLLEKQQGEINTYKETELKLNNQIEIKDGEINKLKKQLEETKRKVRNLP